MENDLSSVVDSLPGLVWTAQPDGQVDFLNRHWCAYTGLSVDEAYGSGWQLAIHPDDRPSLLDRWRSILAAGEPGSMEARLRRFDGEYRWFQFCTSPSSTHPGQIVKWCGTGTDVDDLRRSAMGQHPREDGYHSVADIIPAMIAFLTAGRRNRERQPPCPRVPGHDARRTERLESELKQSIQTIFPSVIAASERAAATGRRNRTTSTTAYAAPTASIAGFTGASCPSWIREVVSFAGTS